MSFDLRGRVVGRDRLMTNAIHAVQYLEGKGHERPVLMAYSPVARVNTYSSLMYSRLWQHGVAPLPLIRFSDIDVLLPLLIYMGVRVILHLQWTSDILRNAATGAKAKEKVDEFIGQLDKFLGAGGRLTWTVHNVLPHDCKFPHIEAALRQAVADRARLVHVLNDGTLEATAEWFTIAPEKSVHIPHPHYVGSYPDIVSRDQARYDLGLLPDEMVYAFVGAIKPYKGLEQLLDAFDAVLEDGRPRRLLVAGLPDEDAQTQKLLDRCLLHPYVELHPTRIPDGELQYYLRAADVAVLPYQRSLNSGVLMLALSFGLPVVAPDIPATAEILTVDVARTFQPGDQASLTAALASAEKLKTTAAREEAQRIARKFDPGELAAQFAVLISRVAADWPLVSDAQAS
jgi:glycosyltransferase involved in cell wall biosynthesis